MIINPVEVIESDDEVKIQSLIEYSDKKNYLWYSIPKKYVSYLTTEKLDGFLVGVLLLAMRLGEDITVKGAVSEKLYFNLIDSYIDVIQHVMPALKKITINPQYLDNGKTAKCEGAVVTGFSAGIDSFCTIYDYYYNAPTPAYKITHLVFNNVGAHDEWDPQRGRKIFNTRYELLEGYPKELGLEFIKIDSNLSDILKWNFEQTFVPRNISAILILQKLFAKYYLSSSYQYEDCVIKPNYAISFTEPTTLQLLSTETLECISVGCKYSRVEKTKKVAQVLGTNHWLNVCLSPSAEGKNCSSCPKCLRTMLTLEILGVLKDFKHVFDLDEWRKQKTSYLLSELGNKEDPYIKEIIDYANSVGYSFKPWIVVTSNLLNFNIGDSGVTLSKFFKRFSDYVYNLRVRR